MDVMQSLLYKEPVCASVGEEGDTKGRTWIRAYIHFRDWKGWNALHYASAGGNVRAVKMLLEAEASICAPECGHRDISKEIVWGGAQVDTRDQHGSTPLMYGAQCGHKDVVEALIRGGAQVDSRDQHGNTPLMHAVQYRHPDVVEALIRGGASGPP